MRKLNIRRLVGRIKFHRTSPEDSLFGVNVTSYYIIPYTTTTHTHRPTYWSVAALYVHERISNMMIRLNMLKVQVGKVPRPIYLRCSLQYCER